MVSKNQFFIILFYINHQDIKYITCQLGKIEIYITKMNLDMVRPKNETKGLLISITKNCETLITQIHTKPQETIEFKNTQSRETFCFKLSVSIEVSWIIELTSLEVYNSIFNITDENYKFELYTNTFNGFSFVE